MSNTAAAAQRIFSNHCGPGWESGRFGIERKCGCAKSQRGSECASTGWHLVASSDDLGDALCCARELSAHGTYRVVDQDDYSIVHAA